jgi:hypothetical protein
LLKQNRQNLDPKLKTIISQMYMAAANKLTRKTMFDIPKLADIIKNVKNIGL